MTVRRGLPFSGVAAIQVWASALLFLVAAPAHATEVVCRPNYDFCVEVDGSFPGDARFYTSQVRGKFFIDIPSSKDGLLMDRIAQKIFAVPRNRITPVEDGLKVRDDLPTGTAAYAFTIEGPILQFQADDKKVRVMPVLMRPPIIGPVTLEDLLADRAEYREAMKTYTPDKAAMDTMRNYRKAVELEVYFATWCSHCKMYMPKFLRVVRDAKNPNLKVNLVGVPKSFGTEKGPWQDRGVQTIPTIFVKVEGRDITRLGTQETAHPEIELAGIFQAVH